MNIDCISMMKVNSLIEDNISNANLTKRAFRTKQEYLSATDDVVKESKRKKYIELCLVKAHNALQGK